MNNFAEKEKLKFFEIRQIFIEQIEWYHQYKDDPDFIYDELYDQFHKISRGSWVEFIILLEEIYEKLYKDEG